MSKGWSKITDARSELFAAHALDLVQTAYGPLLRRAQALGAGYLAWATERQSATKAEFDRWLTSLRSASRGYENAASRACAPSPAESVFSEDVDAEASILSYIDRFIAGRADEDWASLDTILVSGDVPVVAGTFVCGQWNMLEALRDAEARLRRDAMFYVRLDFQQSVVEPAVTQLRDELTRLNGMVFTPREGASGFDVFQAEVSQRIQHVVSDLRTRMVSLASGPREMPAEVRSQWQYIEEVVDRAERVYLRNDAIELYDLPVSSSQAVEMVKWLDEMNPYIPDSLRVRFEIVYRIVANYVQYMGRPAGARVFYKPEQRMTDSVRAEIDKVLDDAWSEMMEHGAPGVQLAPPSGVLIEQQARARGLSEEWAQWRSAERQALEAKLDAIKENPWLGPCAPNYDGVVVPFDAFEESLGLYSQWVRQQVRDSFARLSARVLASAEDTVDAGFVLAADYAGAVLNAWEERFRRSALGDVRFRSIYAEQWGSFAGVIRGSLGVRYGTVGEWEAFVEQEGERLINEGVRRVYDRLASAAREMPSEFARFEELVRYEALHGLSDARLNELYDELRALESQIPPDERSMLRYENVVDVFRAELEQFRGGARESLDLEDAVAYVERHEQRLIGVYADVAALWDAFTASTSGTQRVAMQVGGAMRELRGQCLGWTVAGGMSRPVVEQRRADLLHRLEGALDQWREAEVAAFRTRFDDALRQLEASRATGVSESLKQLVDGLLRIDCGRFPALAEFRAQQDTLRRLYDEVSGQPLGSAQALAPFVHFEPLKSRAGQGVESFTDLELEEFIREWAMPRLERGLYVEPKVYGYRCVVQVKGGEVRIFLEGDPVDRSAVYPELVRELSTLPDVVLDGELVDRIGDQLAPDVESGRFSRSSVDAAEQVLVGFDLLYADGRSFTEEALEVRRRRLREFVGKLSRRLEHFVECPVWYVNSEEGLREKLVEAAAWPGSEGAMVKVPLSTYKVGGTTGEWAKLKRTVEVRARVLSAKRTRDDRQVYECGLLYQGERDLDPKSIRRLGGERLVSVGTAFASSVSANVKDVLLVRVAKVSRSGGRGGLRFELLDPAVVDVVDGAPDTIGRLVNVSRTLTASITQPYRELRRLEQEALRASEKGSLAQLSREVFDIYRGLNVPRLRTLAWAVYEGVEKKLSELGVKGGMLGPDAARVALGDVQQLERNFGLIESSVSMKPDDRVDDAKAMLDVVVGWLQRPDVKSDAQLANYVSALGERIRVAVESWGGSRQLSPDEIKSRLSALGQRAYDAWRLPVSDLGRVAEAIRVRSEATDLMELIGRLLANPDYGAAFGRILGYVEKILDEAAAGMGPSESVEELAITYEQVVFQLSEWSKRIPELTARLARKDEAAYAELQAVSGMLSVGGSWAEKLTARQRQVFGPWLDGLREQLRQALDVWKKALGGALALDASQLIEQLVNDLWAKRESNLFNPYLLDEAYGSGRASVVQAGPLWVKLVEERRLVLAELRDWAESVEAWPAEDARAFVEAKVREVVAEHARRLEEEWRSKFSDEAPEPLGKVGVESAPIERWLSPVEVGLLTDSDSPYIRAQLEAGNSVLVRYFESEPARVLAIVDAQGRTLAGDTRSVIEWRTSRMLHGLSEERAAEILAETEKPGPAGVPPWTVETTPTSDLSMEDVRDAVRMGAQGVVDVVSALGGGSGYFGGFMPDGRPFFVTARHCVSVVKDGRYEMAPGVAVRLPSGRLVPCDVQWQGAEGSTVDLAILVASEAVDTGDLVPLRLGSATPVLFGQGVYGVALSSYWQEADMVDLRKMVRVGEDEGLVATDLLQALETERFRGGYSGGPVVDATGRVVGVSVAGTPTYSDADSVGYVVPLELLQWAYLQAGIRPMGGAQPFADRVFMGSQPSAVPVSGELVRVTRPTGATNFLLSFDWDGGPRHEIAVLVGGVEDKLLGYEDGKLVAMINEPLSGQREVLERVALVPSRMRGHRAGNRYYEFYLNFERSSQLNGLWALTEDGALDYGAPFFLFRLKDKKPFWMRHRDDAEARGMPAWQRPMWVGRAR